jgi:hypothetical protein
MTYDKFSSWFNRDFWKAFKDRTFPIRIPNDVGGKQEVVRKVYEELETSRYVPAIPESEIVIDKGFGVTRIVPVFRIEDYLVYYYCIKELESVLCHNRTNNTFGGWKLGGQIRKLEENEIVDEVDNYSSRYAFNPRAWSKAFGEFNSLLFSQLECGAFSHVLQFDLSNFYDSVRLDILERWTREEAKPEHGDAIALLFYFLNYWNRKNTRFHPQAVGLPQDALADCSRVLSNFYLQKYDAFAARVCHDFDALYFRYADDQMVLLNDKSIVSKLMLLLTRKLDRYGLRVNQMKVHLWTKDELIKHRCKEIQGIFSEKDDKENPEKVLAFVERYLEMSEDELAKSWNSGFPLLNRLLFADLESLPTEKLDLVTSRMMNSSYLEPVTK